MPKAKPKGGRKEAITPSTERNSTSSVTVRNLVNNGRLKKGRTGSGSTGLTEIVEDLTVVDPGSPMILDTEDPEDDGIDLLLRTVNERLRQARNFLSDEDASRDVEFARHHEKIDTFLQLIANKKAECDVLLYNQVQAMVHVHRSRMNRQKAQNIVRPNGDIPLPQSDRLSFFDTSERGRLLGAPLRDDHPPFTLERPVDQNLFIKALHGPPASGQPGVSGVKDRRVELTQFERNGYLETLKNPSLVHERIEEEESQTRDERFNARATNRGRRRAAVRLALRSFATNCEQHYKGRWERYDFRLPSAPVPQNSGGKIVFDKTTSAQKIHDRPFSWTQRYQHYLQAQRDRPQGREEGSLQQFARPLNGNQPVPTEKQAMDLLRAEIMKESQENKQRVEVADDEDWASPASKTGVNKPYFSLNRWSGPAPKPTAGNRTRTFEARPENLAAENLAAPEVGGKFSVPEKSPVQEKKPQGQGNVQIREKSQVQGKSQAKGKLNVREKSQIQRGSRWDPGLIKIARSPEIFFRGDTTFTFAETPFLQAVTSKLIERDLGSESSKSKASKVIQLSSNKFSLPEPAYNPQEATFDPRSGHLYHINRTIHRYPTRSRTENLPKGNDDQTKISKTRAWVPAKKSRAPILNLPKPSNQAEADKDDPDKMDIVQDTPRLKKRGRKRKVVG